MLTLDFPLAASKATSTQPKEGQETNGDIGIEGKGTETSGAVSGAT